MGHLAIRSEKPPRIEIDSKAGAAYFYFSEAEVARTEVKQADTCLVTVDFDSEGNVVGVEFVGVPAITMARLKKMAPFTMTPEQWENATLAAA
jgi:uncharacterized protein YuzE